MPLHDLVRGICGIGEYIEERAHAIAAEDHTSAVFVGLDSVVQPGLGENALQPQRILKAFSNINQNGIPALKKRRVLFH